MRSSIEDTVNEIAEDLRSLEVKVLTEGTTFADLVRIGAKHIKQASGWGDGVENACEISTATLAYKALLKVQDEQS